MRAAVRHRFGSAGVDGIHVVVVGVGKVGGPLVGHLLDAGATVTAADVDRDAVGMLEAKYGIGVVSPEEAHTVACDVFAPCALGGSLVAGDDSRAALRDRHRCGEQPARHARQRGSSQRSLDPLRARLPRQRRRRHQHLRGTRRLRRRAGAGTCRGDLRPHRRRARHRRGRRARAGDGRRSDRRTPPRPAR